MVGSVAIRHNPLAVRPEPIKEVNMSLLIIGATLLLLGGVSAIVAKAKKASRDVYIPIVVSAAYGAVATGIGGADVISRLI